MLATEHLDNVVGCLATCVRTLVDDQGFLVNSFIDTVTAIHPEYVMRVFGGLLYLTGALVMAYNVYKTIRGDVRKEAPMGGVSAELAPAQ